MDTLINELPEWIPTANLILRSAALFLMLIIVWQVRHGVAGQRWYIYELAAVVAGVILVAGALFQANLLSVADWTLLGTAGSALLVMTLIGFLLYRR